MNVCLLLKNKTISLKGSILGMTNNVIHSGFFLFLKIIAEYALRGTSQPIGIAEYELSKSIPENLKTNLPTIEKIERELTITDVESIDADKNT